MRHLAANISFPTVRELHDHLLWRERALLTCKQQEASCALDGQVIFAMKIIFFKMDWFLHVLKH